MKFSVVELFLVLHICFLIQTNADQVNSRIVGGNFASFNQFPHQVALLYKGNLQCGGSIISSKWVITAAHCVQRSGNITLGIIKVLAGTIFLNFFGSTRDVDKIVVHENFDPVTMNNDLALLRLSEEFPVSDSISPIEMLEEEIPVAKVVISGWGQATNESILSNRLKFNTMFVTRWRHCALAEEVDQKRILCLHNTVNNGICIGDAGGGAIYKGKLAGIASFGFSSCRENKPDMYFKVSYYVDWIKTKIKDA